MPTGRTFRVAVAAAAVALTAAAAIVLNLALLGYAQPRNDPVGKLSPRAALLPSPAAPQVPRMPETTHGEADD